MSRTWDGRVVVDVSYMKDECRRVVRETNIVSWSMCCVWRTSVGEPYVRWSCRGRCGSLLWVCWSVIRHWRFYSMCQDVPGNRWLPAEQHSGIYFSYCCNIVQWCWFIAKNDCQNMEFWLQICPKWQIYYTFLEKFHYCLRFWSEALFYFVCFL